VAGLIHSSSFRSKKVRAKCIITAEQNSTIFLKQKCGTREARPKDSRRIPPTNSEFLARLRALIFRQEAGAKSEAILIHSICFGYKNNFLLL